MMKYATLGPNGEIDVVYYSNEGAEVSLIEIEDSVFAGFIPDGNGGFTAPPPPAPSIDERIAQIDSIYKPKLSALVERLQAILLTDGANMETKLTDLRARYNTVTNEYSAAQ